MHGRSQWPACQMRSCLWHWRDSGAARGRFGLIVVCQRGMGVCDDSRSVRERLEPAGLHLFGMGVRNGRRGMCAPFDDIGARIRHAGARQYGMGVYHGSWCDALLFAAWWSGAWTCILHFSGNVSLSVPWSQWVLKGFLIGSFL